MKMTVKRRRTALWTTLQRRHVGLNNHYSQRPEHCRHCDDVNPRLPGQDGLAVIQHKQNNNMTTVSTHTHTHGNDGNARNKRQSAD